MKKKSIKIWGIILLAIAILVFVNWKDYYDKYGISYNDEREKIGVLKIPETWVANERGTKTKLWSPENFNEITKGRYGKEVILKDGKIYLERDRIINKETGKEEVLEVTYQYEEEQKFVYNYSEIIDNAHTSKKELSENEFQEIVKSWQLEL